MRKFSPIAKGDHLLKLSCPACNQRFQVGDETALIPVGPGKDPKAQARAREGRPYNAVALPTHWACATGEADGPHIDPDQTTEALAPSDRG